MRLLQHIIMSGEKRVDRAFWEGPQAGRVDLVKDWVGDGLPPIGLPDGVQGSQLVIWQANPLEYAKQNGYAINGEWITFVRRLYEPGKKIFLAGEFNGWQKAVGNKTWEMEPDSDGLHVILNVKSEMINGAKLFKFVSEDGHWYEPSHRATNIGYENGARNYTIDYTRTGAHVFRFEIKGEADWRTINSLVWRGDGQEETLPLWPGKKFYTLHSDAPMGAILEGQNTTRFRVFAPRASQVAVTYFDPGSIETRVDLSPEADGCWSVKVPQNLEGYSYYYSVDGPHWPHTMFDANQKILDPWALAVRAGAGVVVDQEKLYKKQHKKFETPATENLLLVEAHVRDLLAKAPVEMSDAERRGFAGVRKFLEWEENPLLALGANAVELQPLMEFDGPPDDYHWGYMTTNFMAPASAYAADREKVSQLADMADMVEAFHDKNLAVIVDVVYNHVGVPAHLLFLDKAYYFRTNSEGGLTNWSGCGNDLRAQSAMAERLLLDSLEHWVRAFNVDGFRFDLAELLGVNFLKVAQEHLHKIKPGIILIAEPWSFRGHIAGELRSTEYASWNDGFREFVPAYLSGRSNAEAAKYFVRGSVGGVALEPWQSINYVESHDDRTWIDRITENPNHNGFHPTMHDRRQTHLMATLMTMSLGLPMWAQGAETMRSKHGINNTYQRGDINALDYERLREYPATVSYIRSLNHFRRGPHGHALRVKKFEEGYLQYFDAPGTPAIGVLYNAQGQARHRRLMYFINPTNAHVKFTLPDIDPKHWMQIADHERVEENGLNFGRFEWKHGELDLPAHSAGIFLEKA